MSLIPFSLALGVLSNNPSEQATNYKTSTPVTIKQNVDGNPLASIYLDEDGTTPLSNPINTDTRGVAAFYIEAGEYIAEYQDDLQLVTSKFSVSTSVLQKLGGLTERSDLAQRSRFETTVAEIALGDFKVGDKLTVTDRANAGFIVRGAGWPQPLDGYGVIDAGGGKVATVNISADVFCEYFGAKGDNSTDSTGAIHAAMKHNTAPSSVKLGVGIFLVSNLKIPSYTTIAGAGYLSTTIAPHPTATADNAYLITCETGLTGTSAGQRIGLDQLKVDAGTRSTGIHWRWWGGRLTYCLLTGGVNSQIDITSKALDGTSASGTMVNNIIDHCQFQAGGVYNVYVSDPDNSVTDGIFTNNYIADASTANMWLGTGAGWNISHNHFYGSDISFEIRKGGLGTIIADNFFERDVVVDNILTGQNTLTINDNFMLRDAYFKFGNNGKNIKSSNNTYTGLIYHSYNSSAKHLIMQGDTFLNSNPFTFLSGGALSRVTLVDCYVEPLDRFVTAKFIGSKSGWDRPSSVNYGNTTAFTQRGSIAAGGAKTASITVQSWLGASGAKLFDITISTRQFDSGAVKQAYKASLAAHAKSGNALLYITKLSETLNAAEFSVTPSFSYTDNGNGTITFTVSWTPIDSDGYGSWYIEHR